MNLETIFKINNNPMLHKYLKENSYWYKILNRNPKMLDKMTEDMKKAYKLTFEDKVENLNSKMNLIKGFMDAIK